MSSPFNAAGDAPLFAAGPPGGRMIPGHPSDPAGNAVKTVGIIVVATAVWKALGDDSKPIGQRIDEAVEAVIKGPPLPTDNATPPAKDQGPNAPGKPGAKPNQAKDGKKLEATKAGNLFTTFLDP